MVLLSLISSPLSVLCGFLFLSMFIKIWHEVGGVLASRLIPQEWILFSEFSSQIYISISILSAPSRSPCGWHLSVNITRGEPCVLCPQTVPSPEFPILANPIMQSWKLRVNPGLMIFLIPVLSMLRASVLVQGPHQLSWNSTVVSLPPDGSYLARLPCHCQSSLPKLQIWPCPSPIISISSSSSFKV